MDGLSPNFGLLCTWTDGRVGGPQTAVFVRGGLVRTSARNSARTLVRTGPLIGEQIKVLFGICYVNLASNACFSVLASFFDKVSEDHGASKSEVGFIFAIFAGINVIVSPIFGYLVPIIGINFMFISGMTLAGGCALLFRYYSRHHWFWAIFGFHH